jgi:DNA-binding Lrp family transcriptional regulator
MFRISDEITRKRIKIDTKDKKILVLLSENSRTSLKEIAKKTQLARDTVGYRIKRMSGIGIIQGFYPELDFKRLGYNLYHVFLLVDETDKKKQQELIEELNNHPNTRSVIQYSDRWDIELIMLAKDVEEFDGLVTDILGKFSSIIIEKGKLAQITTYYSILFPYQFHKPMSEIKIPIKEEIDYKPDKKDLAILNVLGKDCRLSTYEIAKHVDLSPDAIGLRIKRLFKTGIIKKFTILPNLSLLNYSWHTFALQMKVFNKNNEVKFRTFIEDHPYIIKAVKTLGVWDLLLYIISDNSADYHRTIKQIKNEFADIVKNYETWVASKESVFNPMPKIISANL